MATATKTVRTATERNGEAHTASAASPLRFLIFEDNGGEYHWALLDGNRDNLAESPGFASYEDAKRAARVVLDGAGSARLDRASADRPVSAVARAGPAVVPDGQDTDRWMNEGGSLTARR